MSLKVRVGFGVMPVKGYSTLLQMSRTGASHQMQFNGLLSTPLFCVGFPSFCLLIKQNLENDDYFVKISAR